MILHLITDTLLTLNCLWMERAVVNIRGRPSCILHVALLNSGFCEIRMEVAGNSAQCWTPSQVVMTTGPVFESCYSCISYATDIFELNTLLLFFSFHILKASSRCSLLTFNRLLKLRHSEIKTYADTLNIYCTSLHLSSPVSKLSWA